MVMLGLNEAIDQLAMTNSVCSLVCVDVLKRGWSCWV